MENPARADWMAAVGRLNLARVVREAAALVLPLAEQAGRQVEVDAPDVVSINGRADDLRDMVINLLDNALVHGQGAVHISVRSGAKLDRKTVFVEVSDQGAGVPNALREELFDRFRKGEQASPGAGLGLAIVRQVARSHGGDARFLAGPVCSVQVSLPARDGPRLGRRCGREERPHDKGSCKSLRISRAWSRSMAMARNMAAQRHRINTDKPRPLGDRK